MTVLSAMILQFGEFEFIYLYLNFIFVSDLFIGTNQDILNLINTIIFGFYNQHRVNYHRLPLLFARNRYIIAVYQQKYNRQLQKDIIGDTSGHFQRLMVSMCACARDESNVSPQMAQTLAQELYRAG